MLIALPTVQESDTSKDHSSNDDELYNPVHFLS
jgi:hypothetical protein